MTLNYQKRNFKVTKMKYEPKMEINFSCFGKNIFKTS